MRELNLIPYTIKAEREKKLRIKNYVSLAVILICLLFICVYIPKLESNRLKNKEMNLSQQISLSSKVIQDNKKVNSEISQINDYDKKIVSLSKQRVLVSDRIKELQSFMPKDVVLTNLNFTKNVITINGVTANFNSIAEFAANLKGTQSLKNSNIVNINNSAGNSSSKYSFTINISY
ncbi:PilN domain-containing protein [Clostridium sp. YIM B02515]|uniref:PilN domain-containing protein n=1 Tax=Clostridium rhizosphaerae TaxID=2803861 RepID=A0ABS1TD83_9CLOT|nr:PilN domain-containing protein [Clostridium rhizosphaerae]MBL4937196.1 PilN domain-containing protein [Clostridium rhizosphaerae]